MRRRLLVSTLTIAIASLALFGAPLAFVVDRVVHDQAQSRLVRDATRVATALDEVSLSTTDKTAGRRLSRLVPPDDRVVVVNADGTRLASHAPFPNALRATVVGPEGTLVTVESPGAPVDGRVERALLALVALAVLGLGAALSLALVQSSRLANPLARLASSATRLGEGDFSLVTPRSGVPEFDAIAVALDRGATRVDALLRAERSFSTNASHQLRSALTGLQLRLDELATNDDEDVRAEAEAALEQSSRLIATIEELLALARTGRAGAVTEFDVAELVEHHAADAAVLFARAGRHIVVEAPSPAPVRATVGAVGQVVEVLLSNALRHGAGAVTILVSRDDRHAFVDVSDEGPGIADDEIARLFNEGTSAYGQDDGHGIGLALARTLVTAEGGTITLLEARPPQFRVALPLADPGTLQP